MIQCPLCTHLLIADYPGSGKAIFVCLQKDCSLHNQIISYEVLMMVLALKREVADYKATIRISKNRLIRELNTLLGGTAENPSLYDVIGFVADMLRRSGPVEVVSLEGGDTTPVTLYKTPFQLQPIIPTGYWLAPDELPDAVCHEVDMFARILSQQFFREARRVYLKSKSVAFDLNRV